METKGRADLSQAAAEETRRAEGSIGGLTSSGRAEDSIALPKENLVRFPATGGMVLASNSI